LKTYISSNIIRVIKARRIRWVDHVARMGGIRTDYKILVGKPEGKRSFGNLGIDGKIILEWILEK
jgi:hypothetical protein